MRKEIELHGDSVWGEKVSDYGLEHGYLDYRTLARLIEDCILNNTIFAEVDDWELVSGEDYNEEDDYHYDIYQTYIISEYGRRLLSEYTNEIVYYSATLDIYLWGITHFGTSWDYVLTDVKLV